MKEKILIFDFDGTIADTFHHLFKIGNRLASEFKFKKVEDHEIEKFKDKPWQEIARTLGIPFIKIPFIAAKASNELHQEIASIKPIKGLKEILMKLKLLGYKMGVVTSNSSKNVNNFLKNHDLDCFDFINTSKIWNKNRSLRKLIIQHSLKVDDIIYIGDETRDIEAAKKAGIRIAAVTWGYNSTRALQSCKPDYLLTNPSELLKLGESA